MTRGHLFQGIVLSSIVCFCIGTALAQDEPTPDTSAEGAEKATTITGTAYALDVLPPGNEDTPVTFIFQQSGTMAVAQGDMIVGDYAELAPPPLALKNPTYSAIGGKKYIKSLVGVKSFGLWPKVNGKVTIPFSWGASFSNTQKSVIIAAMNAIATNTGCIKFVPRTSEAAYANFVRGNGCYSKLGYSGAAREISLGSGCESQGTSIHEIMHVLGALHEHTRADRDNFISVNFANVESGMAPQFEKLTGAGSANLTDYDFESIMHYNNKAFSGNGLVTMTSKIAGKTFGSRGTMSTNDIAGMKKLYSCP